MNWGSKLPSEGTLVVCMPWHWRATYWSILLLACSLCLSPSILPDGSSFLFPHLLPALFSISLLVTSNPASSSTAPHQRESYNYVVLHLYCPEGRCCHMPCGQPQVQITKDTTDFRGSLAIMCDLHEAWNTL